MMKAHSPTKKRVRKPTPAKPGELKVAWGKDDGGHVGLILLHGAYGAYAGHTLALDDALRRLKVYDNMSLVEYLDSCGFDITTLKFSINHSDPRGQDGSLPPVSG